MADNEDVELGADTGLGAGNPLDPDLVAVYQVLLEAPLTTEECSDLVGRPLTSELERLAAMRLVRPSLVEPGRWETVAPDAAIAAILAPVQARAHALALHSDAVRKTLGGLETLYQAAYRKQYAQSSTEIVRGGDQVRQRLSDLATRATHEVVAVHPTMAPVEVLRAGLELDRGLLDRGIDYQVVWPHSARRQQDAIDYMRLLRDLGGTVRTAAMLPSRMILLDRSVALIPLPAEEGPGAAIVRDPVVLDFMVRIFEHIWERARPVEEICYDTTVFGEIELAILQDLAGGHTDEAIARRLGISTRTLRRYLTTLFERLGVETRFQLGIAAMRAGLIQEEDEGPGSPCP
ncbi:LuxR C-terminal-related transcriptional regulator [Actinokineospora sp. PR83]|uniref:helix-turn-helix transcriptional regulator n=1 Tax=Actinokineospora sp. PR83 TaxID=2884908 RepID=UPI0027DFD216|nr:LuxR family transcriptional regulator [Actinokineospora sp. PR83]MCG8914787.1 LuxR C-terminal-related transcriptional regulator [Actinokineospora sp. PR83]